MIYSPRQELYDALYEASEQLGYDTYQFLPPAKTPYPFVVMGSMQSISSSLKTAIQDRVIITIHVWGDQEGWSKVDSMMMELEKVARNGFLTDHYRFQAQINEFDAETMIDDSVANTVLNHGLLTLSFLLS
ncbi:hypothetical protein [Limosilactobacillus fermentum]|uniref:hypothetical protein n=1 Tax=Limosilactobacillus fermentum TaxID=1613 RepID=UPI002456ED0D|nr:hypothetical protein [Limosilactobacillus fermentum]MDH5017582.1 hypothetical protein [Limosilactobacillus fermentum]